MSDYERQGTSYDPHAFGHEAVGRDRSPDKSAFFNIVLRRGSGKYLSGRVYGSALGGRDLEFWTDDIDMALRFWSPSGAAVEASGLTVKVNAVGYQQMRTHKL